MKLISKTTGFPFYKKTDFFVWKTFISIIFLFSILLFHNCKVEEETEPLNIIGKWQVIDSSNKDLAYIIFTTDSYYHFLYKQERNQHDVQSGVFIRTSNFLDLDGTNTNFVLTTCSDTLILDHPSFKITCVRDSLAPEANEWLIPVEVVQEIQLNIVTNPVHDMAYDGNNIWISYNYSFLFKLDNKGNKIEQISIDNSGGLAYGNGHLWTGKGNLIYKVDTSSKKIIKTYSFSYYHLKQLAYEPGYIWAYSSGEYKLIKLNEISGKTEGKFKSIPLDGLSYANGQLWAINENFLFTVDTSTGNYINSYKIETGYYPDGLIFDGVNFWASEYISFEGTNKIYKLEIK